MYGSNKPGPDEDSVISTGNPAIMYNNINDSSARKPLAPIPIPTKSGKNAPSTAVVDVPETSINNPNVLCDLSCAKISENDENRVLTTTVVDVPSNEPGVRSNIEIESTVNEPGVRSNIEIESTVNEPGTKISEGGGHE
jgi:hypothetical protein